MPDVVLKAEGVTKRFGEVAALSDVTFDLREGEVHCLCGENGAGKSTLIKVLSGLYASDSTEGELQVRGRPIRFESIRDAEKEGIAVIYQELALVPEMSVAENIFLGHEPKSSLGMVDWNAVLKGSREILDFIGFPADPEARVGDLGIGEQQLVEIVRALRRETKILILDEPTAALTEAESDRLLELLRQLKEEGLSCIYISHRLEEVFEIADRITVLRDGKTVSTKDVGDTSRDQVIREMVGRDLVDLFPESRGEPGVVMLEVDGLTVSAGEWEPPLLEDVHFEVRSGEVLGIGGLMGARRTELLLHLYGAWGYRVRGRVLLGAKAYDDPSPVRSLERGLAMVTEDRKAYGLIPDGSIQFNLTLSSLGEELDRGMIDGNIDYARSQKQFEGMQVRAPSLETEVGVLSGGNQQKVVLGRALLTKPKVMFLDEPTRGIDVGARREIYDRIRELTEEGMAVVLVSSELPELMGMSDRIIVLSAGRMGGEFEGRFDQESLMQAAMRNH